MARTPRSAAEKLAMRKKKSRALLLFNIIAFSVVVIGAVLLCIFVFFKVGNVTFTSDAGYDEADIRRVCGINEGDNLVLLETESREKALEHRFPYIESAKIVKHIPSTIEIEITPAETAFSVACDAGYLYVSASGKVLEIASQPCEDTTVVLGANPTNTKPSETITFGDDSVKEVYNAIAEQMTKNETQNVTEINMTNPYDLTLTYDNRITPSIFPLCRRKIRRFTRKTAPQPPPRPHPVMPQAARTAQTAPQTATGRTAILPIPRVIPTASRTPQQTTAVTTRATPKTCKIWKRSPVFHKFFG